LTAQSHHARCFGLDWHSDIALEYFDTVAAPSGGPAVHLSRIDQLAPRQAEIKVGRTEIDSAGFRFSWNEEVVFDVSGGDRIAWLPGPRWKGALPDSFYSSVAGLTLALRGVLALHASSLIIDGKAWLFAGKAGAGKSTLVAELLGAGAELLADDLTAVSLIDGRIEAHRGRPAMRLHPASAQHVVTTRVEKVPHDPRGKLLVWPSRRATDKAWPVAGLMLLGGEDIIALSRVEAATIMTGLIFRPRISAKLAGLAGRQQALIALAAASETWRFPQLQFFEESERQDRLAAALNIIRGAGASS
jgi:hypothetical protein